ncbi:MAG: hypothetical protein Q8S00_15640 [Deltaproteobacteria bacterium]|nr:hypothetical protein [Deltaproteobacteria bacterium]
MTENNAVEGVCDSHAEAEATIKNNIMEYETAINSDNFPVIAHGTADEMAKAKSILETTRAAQVAAHRRWTLTSVYAAVVGIWLGTQMIRG